MPENFDIIIIDFEFSRARNQFKSKPIKFETVKKNQSFFSFYTRYIQIWSNFQDDLDFIHPF